MRAHILLCLALFAVAGCSLIEKSGGKTRQDEFRAEFASGTLCSSDTCTVKITVPPGCVNPIVDPPILGVDAKLVDGATIKWEIQRAASPSDQATFVPSPRRGINPKQGSVLGWHREFRNPNRVSDTVYTWDDRNRLSGAPPKRPFDYEIEMVQNGRRCHVDPTIVNEY
jgi:hypothetical protein